MKAEPEDMEMDITTIKDFIREFLENDPANRVPAELAKSPDYIGRRIYKDVVCGAAPAKDEVLVSLETNTEANIELMQPEAWLEGAQSVISLFLSFEKWITEENIGGGWPTGAWLHGRIEGQAALNKVAPALAERIKAEGYEALTPALDPRFKSNNEDFTSNWSERHVAFACGLGTFGLSRGIITELGMAGRLMSLVTTLPLEPTPRPYKDLLEYCIKCGSCIPKCPADAISVEHLKNNRLCSAFVDEVRSKEEPYYGCGKCQCGVPCAYGIPT